MRLRGVELATFASLHDLRGVGDCNWPVETLPKRITHEGAWRRVMATYSGMDVSKHLPTFGNGDAMLQDSRGAALVQLPVDHNERLGPPSDASRLSAVRG